MKYIAIGLIIILTNCSYRESTKNNKTLSDVCTKRIFLDTLMNTISIKKIASSEFSKKLISKKNPSQSLIISPTDFKKIYQKDTLLAKYNPDTDYGYFYGTIENRKYRNLVILRSYGEWIKSLEYLTYDNNGKLKGMLFLAGIGGDYDDYYECYGTFLNDSIYQQVTIQSLSNDNQPTGIDDDTKYDTIRNNYVINKNGEVSLISKKINLAP